MYQVAFTLGHSVWHTIVFLTVFSVTEQRLLEEPQKASAQEASSAQIL